MKAYNDFTESHFQADNTRRSGSIGSENKNKFTEVTKEKKEKKIKALISLATECKSSS